MKYLIVILALLTITFSLQQSEINETIQCIDNYLQSFRDKMVLYVWHRTANTLTSSWRPSLIPWAPLSSTTTSTRATSPPTSLLGISRPCGSEILPTSSYPTSECHKIARISLHSPEDSSTLKLNLLWSIPIPMPLKSSRRTPKTGRDISTINQKHSFLEFLWISAGRNNTLLLQFGRGNLK